MVRRVTAYFLFLMGLHYDDSIIVRLTGDGLRRAKQKTVSEGTFRQRRLPFLLFILSGDNRQGLPCLPIYLPIVLFVVSGTTPYQLDKQPWDA
jgi:hypothetical protein